MRGRAETVVPCCAGSQCRAAASRSRCPTSWSGERRSSLRHATRPCPPWSSSCSSQRSVTSRTTTHCGQQRSRRCALSFAGSVRSHGTATRCTPAEMAEFLDTSLLLYAYDPSEGARHETSADLVVRLARGGDAAVSVQVLQEFYVIAVSKIAVPLSPSDARRRLRHSRVGWCMSHFPKTSSRRRRSRRIHSSRSGTR